jgi:hypothetical protein
VSRPAVAFTWAHYRTFSVSIQGLPFAELGETCDQDLTRIRAGGRSLEVAFWFGIRLPLYFQSAHLEARDLRLRIPAENAGNSGGGEENLAQRLLFRQ